MRGITTIEGQNKFELATMGDQVNDEELEKIKNEYGAKYGVKLEPLFDFINRNKLDAIYKNKLLQSLEENVNLYYYLNIEYFINIINYVTVPNVNTVKKLKELHTSLINDKIPKKLLSSPKDVNLDIYHIRYKSLLIRYTTFLINIFA
jgi:hypothetical protein